MRDGGSRSAIAPGAFFAPSLFWCKLLGVRRTLSTNRRSMKAVLFVLLALQLVLGLQLQAARAVASPMPTAMHAGAHHSPATSTSVGGAAIDHGDQASQPDCPDHSTPHDCCHASACQCQCVYTPGAIALPALANIATSIAVPSLATTQFVAPRIDEFLRPPIA
jgi:hypothetical protein